MAALALIGAALAHPPDPSMTAEVAGMEAGLSGALGARLAALVGEDAAVSTYDGITNAGVTVIPVALTGSLRLPQGGYALLRVEEGAAHAGSLEAAEARVGVHTGTLGGYQSIGVTMKGSALAAFAHRL